MMRSFYVVMQYNKSRIWKDTWLFYAPLKFLNIIKAFISLIKSEPRIWKDTWLFVVPISLEGLENIEIFCFFD